MIAKFAIREAEFDELAQILAVYPLAFPDEELRPIVTELIEGDTEILSLAAFHKKTLIGHVLFTFFSGNGAEDFKAGALLGPLCVLPDYHGQGAGSALVISGVERLNSMGTRQLFVLGDPNYYGRFGFKAEHSILPPYELPKDWIGAWQSMTFSQRKPLAAGKCHLPKVWMDRTLWVS